MERAAQLRCVRVRRVRGWPVEVRWPEQGPALRERVSDQQRGLRPAKPMRAFEMHFDTSTSLLDCVRWTYSVRTESVELELV